MRRPLTGDERRSDFHGRRDVAFAHLVDPAVQSRTVVPPTKTDQHSLSRLATEVPLSSAVAHSRSVGHRFGGARRRRGELRCQFRWSRLVDGAGDVRLGGIARRSAAPTERSTTADQATYSITAPTYRVTISATQPSWDEVTLSSGPPVFARILEPGDPTGFDESAAVSVQVGAGGTRVTASAGRRSRSLMSPVAPYTFVLSPS